MHTTIFFFIGHIDLQKLYSRHNTTINKLKVAYVLLRYLAMRGINYLDAFYTVSVSSDTIFFLVVYKHGNILCFLIKEN